MPVRITLKLSKQNFLHGTFHVFINLEGKIPGGPGKLRLGSAPTCSHQQINTHPGSAARLKVGQGIPNQKRMTEVNVQISRCPQDQTRLRFSANTILFWRVRANINAIHPPPASLDLRDNLVVDFQDLLQAEDFSPHNGLIRHQDNLKGTVCQSCQCRQGSW